MDDEVEDDNVVDDECQYILVIPVAAAPVALDDGDDIDDWQRATAAAFYDST